MPRTNDGVDARTSITICREASTSVPLRRAVTTPIMSANGKHERQGDGEQDGGSPHLRPDQLDDRPIVGERAAEIEPRHAGDPIAVADKRRTVEPELVPHLREGLLVGRPRLQDRRRGVAREQLHRYEDDGRSRQQCERA